MQKKCFYGFYTKLRRWGWLPHRQACRPSANHHLHWQVWRVRRSPFGASCSTIWDPFWPISWWKNEQTKGLSIISHQGNRKKLAISRCPFLGKKLKSPFRPTWYLKPRLDRTRDRGIRSLFMDHWGKGVGGVSRMKPWCFSNPKLGGGGTQKLKKKSKFTSKWLRIPFLSKFRAI